MNAKDVGVRYGKGGKTVFRAIQNWPWLLRVHLLQRSCHWMKLIPSEDTNILTILADCKRKIVVGVVVGKDKDAFAHALVDMEVRGADRIKVGSITRDMYRKYVSKASGTMRQAGIGCDSFHLANQMNESVDRIR